MPSTPHPNRAGSESVRASSFQLLESPRPSSSHSLIGETTASHAPCETSPRGTSSAADLRDDCVLEEPQQQGCSCLKCCKARHILPCVAGALLALCIGCLLIGLLLPSTITAKLEERAQVCGPSSSGYDDWLTNDPNNSLGVEGPFVPQYREFWAWNLTNQEEYLAGGKAILQEAGPYSYHSYKTRFDITFTEATQKFRNWNRLEFSPETSCATCSEDDLITSLNPVYLEAITKTQGETNLILAAGIPFLTQEPTCIPQFTEYSNASCPAMTSKLSPERLKELSDSLCCVLTQQPETTALLKGLQAGKPNKSLADLLGSCVSATATAPTKFTPTQEELDVVASCALGFWGVPEYNPQPNNLFDEAKAGFKALLEEVNDGLLVTQSVGYWYKGGSNILASLLKPGKCGGVGQLPCWPGYGIKHFNSLEDARADPTNMPDEVVSGCGGTLNNIGTYLTDWGVSSYNFSYWGVDVSVPVTGSNGQQTVPRGGDALRAGNRGPHSKSVYEWTHQLRRPAQLNFSHSITFEGVHLNRFEIPARELLGDGPSYIPGVSVSAADLGVGHVAGQSELLQGVVDVTPREGFPVYVTKPHYFEADPVLLTFATLIPVAGQTDVDYSTYMDIEPATGTTFRGHQRLQGVSLIDKAADGSSLTSVFYPNVVPQVPLALYWLDQTGTISDHDLSVFKDAEAIYTAALWTLYIGPALAGLLAAICTVFALRARGYCTCSSTQLQREDLMEDLEADQRGSSLLSSDHSKMGYPGSSSWSERCSLAKDCATTCTNRLSACSRASGRTAPGSSFPSLPTASEPPTPAPATPQPQHAELP